MQINDYFFTDVYHEYSKGKRCDIKLSNILNKTNGQLQITSDQNPDASTQTELVFFYDGFAVLKIIDHENKSKWIARYGSKDKDIRKWWDLGCENFVANHDTHKFTLPSIKMITVQNPVYSEIGNMFFCGANKFVDKWGQFFASKYGGFTYIKWGRSGYRPYIGLPKEFKMLYQKNSYGDIFDITIFTNTHIELM